MSAFSHYADCHETGVGANRGRTRLLLAFLLTGGFMVVEVIGGWLFNSLALLADGGHMLSDTLALGMAWFASRVGRRSANDTHTFGFRRGEILAAFINGLLLWVMVAFIAYEAFQRVASPQEVQGAGMLATASIGLGLNVLLLIVLARDRRENLNLKGAFLHVISDALGSIGAVGAAVAVIVAGCYWVDPVISLFICVLIIYSTIDLLREATHILMEGVPPHIDIREIEQAIHGLDGVCCVYDLHIWSIAGDQAALSAHVVMTDAGLDRQVLLDDINRLLHDRFLISHSTVQLESGHDLRVRDGDHRCRIGTTCRAKSQPEIE